MDKTKTLKLAAVAATAAIGTVAAAGLAGTGAASAASADVVNVDLSKLKAESGSVLAQAIDKATSEGAVGPLNYFNSVAPRL